MFTQLDIRHLNFTALKKAGYRGAVFDKDNCLTHPHKDVVVPEIQEAWDECKRIFGDGNILIVSNSAGTWLDPGGIQCESVIQTTGVPVLRHRSFKPAYSCISAIRSYFSSLRFPIRDEELIVVGDRVFTDIVMANRMQEKRAAQGILKMILTCGYDNGGAIGKEKDTACDRPPGPLAVWTTGVWTKEAMVMRWCEKKLVDAVRHWSRGEETALDTAVFVREAVNLPTKRSSGMTSEPFTILKTH